MKILKAIHKAITFLMVVLFFVSISCMDSEKLWIPITAFIMSGSYLLIHGYCTGAWLNSIEDGDK